ncbi:hypothetical protein LCGC14_3057280, partial [marine sediment metagenome]
MKRVRIEFTKTHGEPFPGFKVYYAIPTITFTYYKSIFKTTELYIELTWLFYMALVV